MEKKELIREEFKKRDLVIADFVGEESKGLEKHPLYLKTITNCHIFIKNIRDLTKKAVINHGSELDDPLVVACFDSYEESIKNAVRSLFKMLKIIF